MNHFKKPLIAAVVGAFVLAGCTTSGPRQNNGAAIGAALGGLIGATRPNGNIGTTAIGAAIGAGIGGAIGNSLDKQAGDIRSAVNNSDIGVVNTGSELIVTMPNDILFATDSASVGGGLQRDLAALAGVLNDYPNSTIRVVGHTDNVGGAAYNQGLSRRRAAGVAAVLRQNGVASGRLNVIGRGEDQPIASNLSVSGRQQNRRVEIIIRPN